MSMSCAFPLAMNPPPDNAHPHRSCPSSHTLLLPRSTAFLDHPRNSTASRAVLTAYGTFVAPSGRPRKDRVQSATAPPQEGTDSLKVQLGAAPVAALGVVANLAVCLQPEPVGHGPVLLRLAGELHLDLQGLVGRL